LLKTVEEATNSALEAGLDMEILNGSAYESLEVTAKESEKVRQLLEVFEVTTL